MQLPPVQHVTRAGVKWPPRVGEPYPDLELFDQTGQKVRLSSFKGSVLLIEPVGMTCPACQAFAGAHRHGSFEGVVPQHGLPSIEELFPRYTNGLSLDDDRIVLVQLLLYSMSMGAPSPDDARRWAEHFRMDRSKNFVVLAGTEGLLGPASYNMIPGFQLVDRNFILRADSTGHHPRHDLWRYLLPMVPQLLQEGVH
ncbi:MAG: peroxiredoxin family protein [Candidatus Methylomirabilales bacterium]